MPTVSIGFSYEPKAKKKEKFHGPFNRKDHKKMSQENWRKK